MSYDLNLWTSSPVSTSAIREAFPGTDVTGDRVTLVGRDWIIAIEPPVDVDLEDIPEEIVAALPGLSWLTSVTVEPISAPAKVKAQAISGLKKLALEFRGVVEDPQGDRPILPSGLKRFKPAPAIIDTRVSTLNLNYWIDESPLRTREGRAALIDYLAIHLPEALPRRYGLFEPPTEKWYVSGKDGFLDFMDLHVRDWPVIYTRRPVVRLKINSSDVGWKWRNGTDVFQCSGLALSFENAALRDPGWHKAIRRAWMEIAEIVQPVATNVERVDGWILRGGGRLWADAKTEHGTPTSMWLGIPRKLGIAFALADRYVDSWPELQSLGTAKRGFHHATIPDWLSHCDVSDIIGDPPDEIRERPGRGTIVRLDGTSTFNATPKEYPRNLLFGTSAD